MLAKKWIILICCLVGFGFVIGFAIVPHATKAAKFEITDWHVVDDNGFAALKVDFTTGGKAWLYLKDTDGNETDSQHVSKSDTSATLHMTKKHFVVPEAGEYKLTIIRAWNPIPKTQSFHFESAKTAISIVSPTWESEDGTYKLTGVSFTIDNVGDIQAYLRKGEITIDGKSETLHFYDTVSPGEEKSISLSPHITGITSGSKILTIKLYDGADHFQCGYSETVTPS